MEDYRMFDRRVLYYPSKDVIFYSADVQGNAIKTERLKVIHALVQNQGGTIVTTMDAGMEMITALKNFKKELDTGLLYVELSTKGSGKFKNVSFTMYPL